MTCDLFNVGRILFVKLYVTLSVRWGLFDVACSLFDVMCATLSVRWGLFDVISDLFNSFFVIAISDSTVSEVWGYIFLTGWVCMEAINKINVLCVSGEDGLINSYYRYLIYKSLRA